MWIFVFHVTCSQYFCCAQPFHTRVIYASHCTSDLFDAIHILSRSRYIIYTIYTFFCLLSIPIPSIFSFSVAQNIAYLHVYWMSFLSLTYLRFRCMFFLFFLLFFAVYALISFVRFAMPYSCVLPFFFYFLCSTSFRTQVMFADVPPAYSVCKSIFFMPIQYAHLTTFIRYFSIAVVRKLCIFIPIHYVIMLWPNICAHCNTYLQLRLCIHFVIVVLRNRYAWYFVWKWCCENIATTHPRPTDAEWIIEHSNEIVSMALVRTARGYIVQSSITMRSSTWKYFGKLRRI